MTVSNRKATFDYPVVKVWNLVTSLTDYSWRSDLSKIEVLEDGQKFAEYTKGGFVTEFTITASETCKRWEFDIENENMKGHWTGIFFYENEKTTVDFTETIDVKKIFMKPFAGIYLKKQQSLYLSDLKKALDSCR